MAEYYKKWRPKTLRELVGQEAAVASLDKFIRTDTVPHAILLTGPSGVGKTTIARILKSHLKCSDHDFFERNCADFRGVDDIREIRRHLDFCAMGGKSRVWLIDECHKLTNDAQNAMLKMLEDTPSHVYFMLATTEPQKIIKTIHTRCSQIKLVGMSEQALTALVNSVAEKESLEVSKEVVQEIVEASEGSARKALVILEQVGSLEDEEEQIAAIQTTTFNKDAAINLARTLTNPRATWQEVAKILKELSDQEPEGIRYCVLGYARACMLTGSKISPRAYMIADLFSRNFFDSKHAGLAVACWEVIHPQ